MEYNIFHGTLTAEEVSGKSTATEISRREALKIMHRKAAYERAKREGYAPKEMTMTDISREFTSVFMPTESDPPEPRKAAGFIPYDAPLAILDNTHYLPKIQSDKLAEALRYLRLTPCLQSPVISQTWEDVED